jgi:hypothetical protein
MADGGHNNEIQDTHIGANISAGTETVKAVA